jgi:hypothetical protein
MLEKFQYVRAYPSIIRKLHPREANTALSERRS